MKTILKPYSVLLIFFAFISTLSHAQKTLEGYIYDLNSKTPLPYAAILVGDTGLYTTSNEDGKFEIFLKNIDSLEIRYLGHKTAKVATDYFRSNKIFYLEQFTSVLDEVIVTSNKASARSNNQRAYEQLYQLIKKYRKNKKTVKSKAYFSLTSRANFPSNSKFANAPLEQIEGFYNSQQQLSKGILDLQLKTGRFGQNRLFPFYSLDYIALLEDFNLFKKRAQFLPQYPGNMSLSKIKRRYNLDLQKIENYAGTIIHFRPKRERGDIFSGKIFFQEKDTIIEKIELNIEQPTSFKLTPISQNDSVFLKKVRLQISFNPIDLEKIQYYDLYFDMLYSSGTVKSKIKSKATLYLYDYDEQFIKPYFTDKIDFENDYDRLLTLPVSDEIWKQNYPYPQSKKNTETTNFFKQKNQFYSYYENELPSYSFKNLKISSIVWSDQKKIQNLEIKGGPGVNLNFSYVLNSYKNKNGSLQFTVKTLFDSKTSFIKLKRTIGELECVNLAFDIYELNRHYLLEKLKKSMTLEDAKLATDKAILDARVMSTLMFEETSFSLEKEPFRLWKNKIHTELKKYN